MSKLLVRLVCVMVSVLGGARTLSARSLDAVAQDLTRSPGNAALIHELKAGLSSETEASRRLHFGLIYTLACGCAGDMEEAGRVASHLKERYAGSAELTYIGTDYTSVPCARCDGSGKRQVACRKCKGDARCPQCKGRGTGSIKRLDGEAQACLVCAGDGDCPQCKGAGTRDVGCLGCSGSGSNISQAKLKTTLALVVGTAPQPPDESTPGSGQALSLAGLLAQSASLAQAYDQQQTTALKQEVLSHGKTEMAAMISGQRMSITATIKDVSTPQPGIAELTLTAFNESGHEKFSEQLTLYSGRRIQLRMTGAQARAVHPGATVRLTGELEYRPNSSLPPNGKPFVSIRTAKAGASLGSILMARYTALIDGNTYPSP